MRRLCACLSIAVPALVFALTVRAQDLVIIERPFRAHILAGVVVDTAGSPVSGVLVQECDASFSPRPLLDPAEKLTPMTMLWDCRRDPKHVIASTKTDANGRFLFPQTKKTKTHYLQLSLDGFDPMEIVVKLSPFSRSEPHIQMHVAN
jgi:hypothetical protein